jgi:hypothetical protein
MGGSVKWCTMVGVYLALLLSGAQLGAEALRSEFPSEKRALVVATSAFFDAVETQSDSAGHEFFSDAFAAALPLEDWQSLRLAQLTDHGPVTGLTAYRITWYPVDTLLGAVDFVGRDEEGRNLICGYILWEFDEENEPELRWYHANHLDTWELATLPPEEQGRRLLEANCAHTDIAANFALSKP